MPEVRFLKHLVDETVRRTSVKISLLNSVPKILSIFLLVFGVLHFSGGISVAQQGQLIDRPISQITLEGLERVPEEKVLSNIRVKVGATYDPETAQGDISRLTRLGDFSSIEIVAELRPDGTVDLTYEFHEERLLAAVSVVGNRQLSDRALLGPTGLHRGSARDDFLIQRGIREMAELYRTKGYYLAEVTIDATQLEENDILIFEVIEGPRVRIRGIEFSGNSQVSADILQAEIGTQTWATSPLHGEWDNTRLAADVKALGAYYKDHGYLNVRVGRTIMISPDQKEAKISFLIAEGIQLRVDEIEVASVGGDPLLGLSTQQVAQLIPLKKGEIYRPVNNQLSLDAIQKRYVELGWLEVQVRVLPILSAPGELKIIVEIDEGKMPAELIARRALLKAVEDEIPPIANPSRLSEEVDGQWVRINQEDRDSNLLLAWDLLRRDDPAAAQSLTTEWLNANKDSPHEAEAYFLRALSILDQGEAYESLFDLEHVVRRYPASKYFVRAIHIELFVAKWFAQGGHKILRDADDEAEELFIRITERAPGSRLAEEARLELAQLYERQGQLSLAELNYEWFLRGYPKSPLAEEVRGKLELVRKSRYAAPPFRTASSKVFLGSHASAIGSLNFAIVPGHPDAVQAQRLPTRSADEILDGMYQRGMAILDTNDLKHPHSGISSPLDKAWLAADLVGLELQREEFNRDELIRRIGQMVEWAEAATSAPLADKQFEWQRIKLLALALTYAESVNDRELAMHAVELITACADQQAGVSFHSAVVIAMIEIGRLPESPEIHQEVYQYVRKWLLQSGRFSEEDLNWLDLVHAHCLVLRGFPEPAFKIIENADGFVISDNETVPQMMQRFGSGRLKDLPEAFTKRWLFETLRQGILVDAAPTSEAQAEAMDEFKGRLMSIGPEWLFRILKALR